VDLGLVLERDVALGRPAGRDRGGDPDEPVEVLRERLVERERDDAE
jgi:hypothetical protein